jgi:hypothetical protein
MESWNHASSCHDRARNVPIMHQVLLIKMTQMKQYLCTPLCCIFLNHLSKQVTNCEPRQYNKIEVNFPYYLTPSRFQWSRGLKRKSAAARVLRSWVRIPPEAWIFVCCECCVLSGRGLYDELITRPEKSYRMWCVVVCDLETSGMRRPWPALGRSATKRKKYLTPMQLKV